MIDLGETKCLPELWHVQVSKNGSYFGYYQFFHPNELAAQTEAARLREELPGFELHIGRYALAEASTPSPSTPEKTKLERERDAARAAVSQLRSQLQIARIFVEGKAITPDPHVLLAFNITLDRTKKHDLASPDESKEAT